MEMNNVDLLEIYEYLNYIFSEIIYLIFQQLIKKIYLNLSVFSNEIVFLNRKILELIYNRGN